jgi:hypothetical protein
VTQGRPPEEGVKGRERSRRSGVLRLVVGLVLLLVGLHGARHTARRFAAIRAPVRPATIQEAPAPEHVGRTVVGEPGRGPSTLARIRGLVWRLLACGVVAGVGIAVGAAGAALMLRSAPWRRHPPGIEVGADGRGP